MDCRHDIAGDSHQHQLWLSEVLHGNKAHRSCFDKMGLKQHLLLRHSIVKVRDVSILLPSDLKAGDAVVVQHFTQQTRMTPMESRGDG